MRSKHYLPARGTASSPYLVAVTPESAGWDHAGLHVIELGAGDWYRADTDHDEVVVVPLSGSCTVSCGSDSYELVGRANVFDGPTDFAYVGCGSSYTVSSTAGGRFALGGARAHRQLPFRYVAAADVAVELRGAGNCSRQVHNFATADTFEAESIIACEVITPGGNWSSYPPHKHDELTETETPLEEIYYFEFARGADDSPGFGYHRVYGTPEHPIDVLEEVRDGDVVLVPHGYHGPSIAAPGHHMYYLNIMAGPGPERAWRISHDPAHAWLRDTWPDMVVDPRLPCTRPTTSRATAPDRPEREP
ncbi:5-deoxy-glucuronate isomerase [Nocardia amamiensis]|uniref:5-deoxy-glucuronate isomerase n=1 Tax=Nocardia amamiensis TaxID=404578 RepID=A0ABS0CWD8_9NOCA|nr:5-deoxy-glucuronate isomerase [Nocardia amamiensis]MBF6300927.1 5-deoxy-glucuronate isomerase [Nocardia amamiensis]